MGCATGVVTLAIITDIKRITTTSQIWSTMHETKTTRDVSSKYEFQDEGYGITSTPGLVPRCQITDKAFGANIVLDLSI